MKKLLSLLSCIFFSVNILYGQLQSVENTAFKKGEKLVYRIHYGVIDAAEAVLEVKNIDKKIGSRSVYHIVGTGKSKSAFDWFFKVDDLYQTYIDEKSMVPWLFIRRVNEGGYIIKQDYLFNQYKKTVNNGDGKTFNVPANVHDMLSAFYYARCMDFSNAKVGDIFSVNSFVDNELFLLKIKFMGKETIETDLGKIKCLRFHPVIQTGRIFANEEDLSIWISDDKNHIPIMGEAKILFGSLKMDLQSYEGLLNPLSKED